MRQRLAPFLVLLEARYAPLLFAVAPQSYAVYLWLWEGSDHTLASFWFAVMGALGYELVYVGAIAWAEEGRSSVWTWLTATVALVFSIAVAYYVYRSQGAWAWLHAGFPLVAFTYTLNMHSHTRKTALEKLPERSRTPGGAIGGTQDGAPFPSAPVAPALTVARNGHSTPSAVLDQGATELLGSSEALTAMAVVAEPPSAYTCPHCGGALASKQARGAAVKNGHCPRCKPAQNGAHP